MCLFGVDVCLCVFVSEKMRALSVFLRCGRGSGVYAVCKKSVAMSAPSPLAALASAPSKESVVALVDAVFRHRADLPLLDAEERAAAFGIAVPAFNDLTTALAAILRTLLYASASISTLDEVLATFPADLDTRLKKFLGQIVASRLALWREASIRQRVSLPSLVDVDWRVDVKSSSTTIARIAVPTLLLNLKTRKTATSSREFPGEETLSIELSRGTCHHFILCV